VIGFFVALAVALIALHVGAAALFSYLGHGQLYPGLFTELRRHGVGPCRSGATRPPRTKPGKGGATNGRSGLVRGAADSGCPPLPLRGRIDLSCRGGGRRGAAIPVEALRADDADPLRRLFDELDGAKTRCGCEEADGDAVYCATARLRALGASDHEAARDAPRTPCGCRCHRGDGGAG
jgi:hypothetical protein